LQKEKIYIEDPAPRRNFVRLCCKAKGDLITVGSNEIRADLTALIEF